MIRRVRRSGLVFAAAALAVAALAGSASAFTTTLNQGATGPWLGSNAQWNVCSSYMHRIDPMDSWVGRTARYPNSYQTIAMQPRLDWTPDGRTWYLYRYGTIAQRTVAPGYKVHFLPPAFTNVPSGYNYRVVMEFSWSVGSTRVGRVIDVFNSAADYYSTDGRVFNGGCSI